MGAPRARGERGPRAGSAAGCALVLLCPVLHPSSPSPCPPEENRELMVQSGGIQAAMTAMRLYTWNEHVQVKACWLLASLASQYGE